MKQLSVFTALLVIAISMFLSPSNVKALEPDTLLYDNFNTGSTENWLTLIGEWVVDDAKYCENACGT